MVDPPEPEIRGHSEVPPDTTRTLRMTIAYDGTNYCGWQVQPNGTALQTVVERALSNFTSESIRVVASGRTDAGVHALGQVISFTTQSTAPCHAFVQGLARHLPEDVVIRDVEIAPTGFNARYDAKRKRYRYIIHNSVIRIPFLRNAVLWQRSRLNHEAMHDAVQCLIGTHDFRCFETQWPNRSSSVRTVSHASVERMPGWNMWHFNRQDHGRQEQGLSSSIEPRLAPDAAPFISFEIEADGFLYNMVRAIVGTLIHVGRGRWNSADMQRILTAGNRIHAGETAPPQGLYLMQVDY